MAAIGARPSSPAGTGVATQERRLIMTALSVKTSEKSEQKSKAPVPASEEGFWPSLAGLRQEIDSLFENFTHGWPSWPAWRSSFDLGPLGRMESSFGVSIPATDLVEKDNIYELSAEMPGLDASNVDVSVSGNMLTIKGEKKEEKEEKGKNTYLSERRYGSFQRSFQLPDGIDKDKIEAKFENGVLAVTMPKTAEAVKEQKTIAVKAA
jgi:HSP20 family protein